jgi:hypothetical protein
MMPRSNGAAYMKDTDGDRCSATCMTTSMPQASMISSVMVVIAGNMNPQPDFRVA